MFVQGSERELFARAPYQAVSVRMDRLTNTEGTVMKPCFWIVVFLAATLQATPLMADSAAYSDPRAIPAVRAFLAESGGGTPHPMAPAELAQFGRLVGVWDASLALRKQDGSWVEGAPALWVWKYILDGFATQDLWIHTADHLPVYLRTLGRPYLLTGLRIYDPRPERGTSRGRPTARGNPQEWTSGRSPRPPAAATWSSKTVRPVTSASSSRTSRIGPSPGPANSNAATSGQRSCG